MNLRRSVSTFFCLLLAIGLPLEAAAPKEPVSPADIEAKPDSTRADSQKGDYVLQPQDLIRVQVFQEEDLNREVRVSQELTITLPLVGSVDLRGKTVRQAEEQIRQLYDKDFLVNPQVNVIVVEYWKRFVKVFGAVNTPGVVVFPPEEGLTLLGAVSRAGGFNRYADKTRVILTRTNAADGKTESFTINADDLLKGRSSESWPLQPDDVINVTERIL